MTVAPFRKLILFLNNANEGRSERRLEGQINPHGGLFAAIRCIFSIKHYREGVITQFFYVGAQIMCWTFIIQYGTHLFMSMGMEEKAAEVLAIAACFCTAGTILLQNIWEMYCLVGISACINLSRRLSVWRGGKSREKLSAIRSFYWRKMGKVSNFSNKFAPGQM